MVSDDRAGSPAPRWARGLVVVVVAGLAVAAIVLTGSGSEARPRSGPQGNVPQFVVECAHSHTAPDDPIVHPGLPGASHLHEFFGATDVDAHTEAADLLGGETTCQQRLDTASYWHPALIVDGEVVQPIRAVAYYRPGPDVDPATLEPYPLGLAMVSGDATAIDPQPMTVASWSCGGLAREESPPACPEGSELQMHVTFPDCWDGRRLDSDDHRSHVARSEGGLCPGTHPVAMPQLELVVEWQVHGRHELWLASGGTQTAHADFLNAWDPDKLANEVEHCLRRELVCGVVSNRATG